MTPATGNAPPCDDEDERMLPETFRATVAAVLSRYFPIRTPSPRLAEKLGTGRWRIEWPGAGTDRRFDLYVAGGDAAVLCVRAREGVWEIAVEGDLAGEAAINLGDCLLRAVCLGARRIEMRTRDGDVASPEAAGVLESFARSFDADGACRIVVRGSGSAARSLRRGLRRGRAARRD
jgi:hypothetical protein